MGQKAAGQCERSICFSIAENSAGAQLRDGLGRQMTLLYCWLVRAPRITPMNHAPIGNIRAARPLQMLSLEPNRPGLFLLLMLCAIESGGTALGRTLYSSSAQQKGEATHSSLQDKAPPLSPRMADSQLDFKQAGAGALQ